MMNIAVIGPMPQSSWDHLRPLLESTKINARTVSPNEDQPRIASERNSSLPAQTIHEHKLFKYVPKIWSKDPYYHPLISEIAWALLGESLQEPADLVLCYEVSQNPNYHLAAVMANAVDIVYVNLAQGGTLNNVLGSLRAKL